MIIAPHPDDEVLGCGGIIKKLSSAGKRVTVLVVTRGRPGLYPEERIINVRNEARSAHGILGVANTEFMDFPAPDLDTIALSEIAGAISAIIDRYETDTLFIPHRGDIHNDHKVVFNASIVAARPVKGCPVQRIFAYETLSETEWAAPFGDDAFVPDLFIDIAASFPAKISAMNCFKSQVREFPNPRSVKSLEALANLRGGTVGMTHAEAFMIIRMIER